jgi:hypothetical protein
MHLLPIKKYAHWIHMPHRRQGTLRLNNLVHDDRFIAAVFIILLLLLVALAAWLATSGDLNEETTIPTFNFR